MSAAAARGARWLDRPLGPFAAVVALGAIAAAYWLMADHFATFHVMADYFMADHFASFRLAGDDFPYLAESRTPEAFRAHLWEPHNAHVVPLFRVLIHVLARVAGNLERLPLWLGRASFGVLVLVMLAGGHFVAAETKDRALGVAAMAGIGVTSVMTPVATWFAASQTLWAALAVLAMLLGLQAWQGGRRPGGLFLLAAAIAAAGAPAFWSGGYAAGPVGAAYVLAGARGRRRMAALVPLAAVGLAGAVLLTMAQLTHASPSPIAPTDGDSLVWLRGITHTGQAIVEALLVNNLGLDTRTTPAQGLVYTAGLFVLWGASRRSWCPSPLEAAGMTLVLVPYLMAYTFRSNYFFDNLRELGWYHAMPQVGGVLFACGWVSAFRPAPVGRGSTRRAGLLAASLVVVLLMLHTARAQRQFLASVYPPSASELLRFPIPSLQRLRAVYLTSVESQMLQRPALARLDQVEKIVLGAGISRTSLRRAFPEAYLPGWPAHVKQPDALDLIAYPSNTAAIDPVRIRLAIGPLLRNEPEPRPSWLAPDQPWPPPRRR